MAIPEGVETVTVSSGAPMTLPDGTLIRGHLRFIAPDLNVIGDEDYIFGGESPAELCHGEFSITLVAPDATNITPTGWTYTVIAEFVNAPGWTRYIDITKDNPNVFLDDVIVLTPGDITNPDTVFVRKAGDTMTGALTLPGAPTQDLHAATKKYVDDHIPDTSDFVQRSGSTMTGELVLFGDPTVALGAAPKQYVDQAEADAVTAATAAAAAESVSLSGDTMTGPLILSGAPATGLGAATKDYADGVAAAAQAAAAAESVSLAGDTMTGQLVLFGDPTVPLAAATKQYVDAAQAAAESNAAAESVSLSGDTMTGPLVLSGDPSVALGAATKQYAESVADAAQAAAEATAAAESVSLSGDTMTGPLVLNADPSVALGASTKQYTDAQAAAAQAAAEATAAAESVSLTGDTMSGELVLFGDPTVALGAAPKQYVDAAQAAAEAAAAAESVSLSGDTMTGPLVLSGDPTVANGAANKSYVDGLDAQNVKLTGAQTIAGVKTFSSIPVGPTLDPTADDQLARKFYVDAGDTTNANAIADVVADLATLDGEVVKLTGNQTIAGVKTFSSIPVLPGTDPVAANEAARKAYVDAGDDARVAVAGDTMTGPLVLHGDPAAPLEAATQQYVDQQADAAQAAAEATAAAESVSITGDTMTGPLVLSGDPATDLGAATKQYVDDTIVSELLTTLGLSTGVLTGGELNVNGVDNTMLDIGDTVGIVIDYVTTPSAPTITKVNFAADTITIANLSAPITWILLDSDGSVVQQTTEPTNTQRRTHLILGAVLVEGGVIIEEQSTPSYLPQPLNQLYDFMDALGPFNISGNVVSAAGTNLQIAKSAGTVFSRGFNHFADGTLTSDPHVASVAAQNPATVRYVTQTPAPAVPPVTALDPTMYDNAGTITAVGGGANSSTIQRIYVVPLNETVNQIVVQYGQTVYADLATAIGAVGTSNFITNPNLDDSAVLVAYAVMTRTATNLSNATQARIIKAARISGAAAGASDSLSLALLKSGGTMMGDLVLAADPDQPLEAATKQYVDAGDATAVKLTGDQTVAGIKTFSSIPVLPASDPTTTNQATRKSYVDTLDAANVKLTGAQTVAGVKTFSSIPVGPASDPTTGNQLTRKTYVDNADAGLATDIATLDGEVVKLTGDQSVAGIKSFTSIPVGPASDPTTDNQLTRKLYVDSGIAVVQGNVDDVVSDLAALDGAVVKLTGDQSVAGIKTFSSIPVGPASDPTTANQLTRKSYVDAGDATAVKLTGNQSISGVKTFSSGINVTAGLSSDRYARKTTTTSRSSTVTITDDPHLSVSVEANATYNILANLVWRPSGSGGFRFGWGLPASSEIIFIDNDSGSAILTSDELTFNVTTGASVGGILVTAGTAGTVTLKWAQRLSDATATVLQKNSSLWLRRVA